MVNIARPAKLDIVCLVTGFVLLLVSILLLDRPAVYDEIPYLSNIAILHQFGLSREFLMQLEGSAGPLYTFVHFLFEPLTNLEAPGIRLVNVLFLVGMMVILALLIRDLGWIHWSHSLFAMAIPKVYVLAGLALTEMPAMFFYSASLFCLLRSANPNLGFRHRIIQAILSGFLLSFAILGRQPYLLTLLAVPLLFVRPCHGLSVVIVVCFFITALSLPSVVFWIWKGLIPPGDIIYYPTSPNDLNIKMEFFILSLFYVAFSFLVIIPKTFAIKSRKEFYYIAIGGLAVVIVNFSFSWINYLPINYVMYALPDRMLPFAEQVFGSISLWVASFFLYKVSIPIIRNPNPQILFIMASLILLCVASAKITWGFSSRYAAQAVPLIILGTAYFYKHYRHHYLWLIPVIILGLISVINYYK